jgi:hypothetical protein
MGQLSSPAPIHEDAPEFSVRVPVTTPDRSAYGEATTRLLARKRLKSTRRAVTLLRTLASDPWAVTEALQWLGEEDAVRRIRLDEVRVSLANLDADRLLADVPPSVSKAVAALLRSSRPLSQTALAEMADVSTRSLRRHLPALLALDLVRETGDGYRLALPFRDGERGEEIVPEPLDDDLAAPQDLLYDVVFAIVDDVSRLSDPEDPLYVAFGWPVDFAALQRCLPRINPWVRVAKVLSGEPDPPAESVAFGPSVEQTPLGSETHNVAV